MKKLAYLLALAILLFSSCAKETVHIDVTADTSFSLGGTTWGLIASSGVFYFGQDKYEIDIYALMPECSKDDLMTFNKNNTITGSYGKLDCPNQDNSYTNFGTWNLSADKKTLEISSAVFNVVGTNMLKCEVMVLNENNMQIKYQTTANGITTTTTSSYKRIK
ncbi:lipocalin family protein [Pedobacter sp. ASV28]|uniref:lipocalin family protein n=1 Tax=Pedobacter sp. ASV28 TaxID=2795123 RepID=UPI0018EB4731|nr:lipocalin family protein [Pedobacter sp. ASV28]